MQAPRLKPSSKEYLDSDGTIRYLDQGELSRPLDMPRKQALIAAAFVLVGIVIGAFVIMHVYDSVYGAAERTQQEIDDNLNRQVSYDMPQLTTLIALDDDSIRQTFSDAGYSMYEYSDPEDYPNGGFMQAHLPADIDYDEATSLFDQGISSLDAASASRLLNGMWMLAVDRSEYLDMRVRYADFSSGSIDAAIDNAMTQQGFSADSLLAENGSGTDEQGNTFKAGTIDVNGTTYQWRISAVPLSEMYGISGLPDNAVFLGIRMTA